tara:strand:- start:330 stop:548 length:219 start_codon:yes stop_codon:yes gene_type:complete
LGFAKAIDAADDYLLNWKIPIAQIGLDWPKETLSPTESTSLYPLLRVKQSAIGQPSDMQSSRTMLLAKDLQW